MVREIEVGDVIVQPGEMKFGRLKGIQLRDSSWADLPIIVANGRAEGPTLTVLSTIHGLELVGIEMIRRLLRESIQPDKLSGAIIALPLGNPLAFRHLSYVTPHYDFANMQGSFPGSPELSTTSRITHQISQVVLRSNYFVDLHCVPQFSTPWTIVNLGFGKKETRRAALAMAQSVGFTTIMEKVAFPPPGPGTTMGFGMSHDIPTIIIETNDWRHFDRAIVDMGARGLLNVLKHVGMVKGEIDRQPPEARTVAGLLEGITVTADSGGMVHMQKKPGDKVSEGEPVARILDLYGDTVVEAVSPRKGYLIGYFLFYGQAVAEGDDLFYVASEFAQDELNQLLS